MSITAENAKIETGVKTPAGNALFITFNSQGYYRIEAEGAGVKPAICNELFTGLHFAKQAISKYAEDNAAALSKLELRERVGPKPKRNANS